MADLSIGTNKLICSKIKKKNGNLNIPLKCHLSILACKQFNSFTHPRPRNKSMNISSSCSAVDIPRSCSKMSSHYGLVSFIFKVKTISQHVLEFIQDFVVLPYPLIKYTWSFLRGISWKHLGWHSWRYHSGAEIWCQMLLHNDGFPVARYHCIVWPALFWHWPDMHCYSLGGPGHDTKQMSASQEHPHFEPCLGFVSTISSHTSETY